MMIIRNPQTTFFILCVSVMHAIVAEPEVKETVIDIDNDQEPTNKSTVKEKSAMNTDNDLLTIWEVEHDESVPFIRNSSTPFESKRCYIIQKRYSGSVPDSFLTYYWVGEYSPKGVPSNAARYAVLLDYKARNDTTEPSKGRNNQLTNEDRLKAPLLQKFLEIPDEHKEGKIVTKIQREAEDYETPTFIQFLRTNGATSFLSSRQATQMNSVASILTNATMNLLHSLRVVKTESGTHDKKMFVLSRKNEQTIIDEVEVSLQVLERYDNEICIVLVSKTVYVYCCEDTEYHLRRGAEELAKIMLKKRGRSKSDYIITRDDEELDKLPLKDKGRISRLFAELPYKPTTKKEKDEEFTPEQLKAILNPTTIWTKGDYNRLNMKHVRVHFDKNNKILRREKNEKGGFLRRRSEVDSNDCYICDVQSNRGLVVWMGEMSPINVRAECAKEAEMYLLEEELHYAMPVNYFDENVKSYDDKKIVYIGLLFNILDRNRMDSVSLFQSSYPVENR